MTPTSGYDGSTDYTLSVNGPVTIDKINVVTNPINDTYNYIDYEGLQLEFELSDGKSFISDVSDYMNSYESYCSIECMSHFSYISKENNGYYFYPYIFEYNISSIDGVDNFSSIKELEPGNYTIHMKLDLSDGSENANNYEFSFGINKKANNIASIEVVEPKTLYYTEFNNWLEEPDIKVNYNDGTESINIDADDTDEIRYYLGESADIQTRYIPDYFHNNNIEITDDLNKTIPVTVVYREVTTTYNITVQRTPYESLSVTPSKTLYYTGLSYEVDGNYHTGDYVDYGGVKDIVLTHKDGTVETFSSCYDMSNYWDYGRVGLVYKQTVDGVETETLYTDVDSYIAVAGQSDTATARFQYGGVYCEYEVSLKDMSYDHIKIVTPPTNTDYLEGHGYWLDLSGMVIRVYQDAEETEFKDYSYDAYNNYWRHDETSMSEEDYSFFSRLFGYSIGGHENIAALAVGEHEITVRMGKSTDVFTINVKEQVIDSLSVESNKTEFLLDDIEQDSIQNIIANSIEYITVDGNRFYRHDSEYYEYANRYGDEINVTLPEIKEAGTYDVLISWLGATCTVSINVVDQLIKSMEVVTYPDVTEFYVGIDNEDCLSYDGLSLKITELDDTVKYYKFGVYEWDWEEVAPDGSHYSNWDDLIGEFSRYNLEKDASNVNWNEIGNYNVILSYKGAEAEIPISVVLMPYTSLEVEIDRTTYFYPCNDSDSIEREDIKSVRLYDGEGNCTEYNDYYEIPLYRYRCDFGIVSEDGTYYQNVQDFMDNGGSLGDAVFGFQYGNVVGTCNITIEDQSPYKVEILNNPYRNDYLVGSYSMIDFDGLILRVYSDEDTYLDYNYFEYMYASSANGNASNPNGASNANGASNPVGSASYPEGATKESVLYFQKAFKYYFDNNANIEDLEAGTHQLHVAIGNTEAEQTIPIEIKETLIEDFEVSFKDGADKFLTYTDEYYVENALQFSYTYKGEYYENIDRYSKEFSYLRDYYDSYIRSNIKDASGNNIDLMFDGAPGTYYIELKCLGATATCEFQLVESVIDDFSLSFEDGDNKFINGYVYLYEKLQLSFNYNGQLYENINVSDGDGEYSSVVYDLYRKYDSDVRIEIPEISTTGEYTITVKWLGATASATIQVVDKLIESMTVVNMPYKSKYIVGTYDYYDLDGLKLGITDLEGNYKEISVYTSEWYEMRDHESCWIDSSEVDGDIVGEYNIYIYNKGVKAAIPISIVESPVESIEITKMPTFTTYVQKKLEEDDTYVDLRGMEFTIHYDDGTDKNIVMENYESMYIYYEGFEDSFRYKTWKYNGERGPELGENAIIATYLGYKLEIPVTVIENPVSSISCTTKPEKNTYFVRDNNVDLYGAEFEIEYKDGTIDNIFVNEHTDRVEFDKDGISLSFIASKGSASKCISVDCFDVSCEIEISTFMVDKEAAIEITAKSVHNAVLSKDKVYQVYKFVPETSGTYEFYGIKSNDIDTYAYLCDNSGNKLASNDDSDDSSQFIISEKLTAGETYYYVATLYSTNNLQYNDCSFTCVLDKSDDKIDLSAENVKAISIQNPEKYSWYTFEGPGTYIDLQGLKYRIEYKDGMIIEDRIGTDDWIYAGEDTDESYNLYGLPMTFEWKEFVTEDDGGVFPASTDTNRIMVSYGGQTTEIDPTFNVKSPVQSIEVVEHPWKNIIINEDTNVEELLHQNKGLKVQVNYNDGRESKVVVWTLDLYEMYLDGYGFYISYNEDTDSIQIFYMGADAQVSLVPESVEISNIELTTNPTKTKYTDIHIGQLNVTEEIDLAGAEFTVTYMDGNTEIVSVTENVSTFVIKEGYEVAATLEGTNLVLSCNNLRFTVPITKATIDDLAKESLSITENSNELSFAENNYKVWSFKTGEAEENQTAEYTFASNAKSSYGYLLNANGSILAQSDENGNIVRELKENTTYYYALVQKDEAENTNYQLTKFVTESIASVAVKSTNPVVGTDMPSLEKGISLAESESDKMELTSASWSPTADKAGNGIVYTLTLKLKAKFGYEFASDLTATMNDKTVLTKSLSSDGTLTLKYTFARTDCKLTFNEVTGFELHDADGNLMESNSSVDVPYKGSVTFTLTKLLTDEEGTTTLKVKANGTVIDPTSVTEDGYSYTYTISNVATAVTVVGQTTFVPKDDEATLTLKNRKVVSASEEQTETPYEIYDQIAVVKGKSVADNEKENVLPVLESYAGGEDDDQFFFGWYNESDSNSNGTGTRFISTDTVEEDKDVYAKWGVGKFSYIYKGLLAKYTILSIDEQNNMKIELSEMAPQKNTTEEDTPAVATYSRAAMAAALSVAADEAVDSTSAETTNTLTLPSTIDTSKLTNQITDETILAALQNAQVVSIAKDAIKLDETTTFKEVVVPETVEVIEDGAFAKSTSVIDSVVIPDTVQEVSAAAFTSEDTSTDATVKVVCSAETAQKLTTEETETPVVEVETVDIVIDGYNHSDKVFTYGDKPLEFNVYAKRTVGTTESKDYNVNVTVSNDEFYTVAYNNQTGNITITPKAVTEEPVVVIFEASGVKKELTFTTVPISLETLVDDDVTNRFALEFAEDVDTNNIIYDGSAKELDIKVKDSESEEYLSTDNYEVSYSNETTNVGLVTITVTGKGNYEGTLSAQYLINPKSVTIMANSKTVKCTDEDLNIGAIADDENAKLSYESKDTSVAYVNESGKIVCKSAGTTKINVKVNSANYVCTPVVIDVTVEKADKTLFGLEQSYTETYEPNKQFSIETTVSSGEGVAYESTNKEVATVDENGTVTIVGAGETTLVVASPETNLYNEVIQTATLTVKENVIDLSKVTFDNMAVTYDGKAHSIEANNVPEGVKVDYTNNGKTNAGTYTVTANFTAEDSGYSLSKYSMRATLTINKATIDTSKVTFANKTVTYNGSAHSITATNIPSNVEVTYEGNGKKDAGSYTVKATIASTNSNYSVNTTSKTATMKINAQTIADTQVSLKDATLVYNGKAQLPVVIAKDAQGNTIFASSYAVKANRTSKLPADYTLTITFKGNYAGTVTKSFCIEAKATKKISKVTTSLKSYNKIKISWKKVKKVAGYYVAYKKTTDTKWTYKFTTKTSYTTGKLATGTAYDIRVYTAVKIGSKKYRSCTYKDGKDVTTLTKVEKPIVVKSSSKKVKISWTNIAGETGYQISQATSKGKTKVVATVKSANGKTKTIKAKKNKNLWYKVRAYKTVSGKKIYGPWSTAVQFKLK